MDHHKTKGVYLLEERAFQLIYSPDIRQQIEQLVEIVAPPLTPLSIKRVSHNSRRLRLSSPAGDVL